MLTAVFLKILQMSAAASLVILAVMLVRIPLKLFPKILSYALWAVVLVRLLCPVAIRVPFGFVPEMDLADLTPAADTAVPSAVPHVSEGRAAPPQNGPETVSHAPAGAAPDSSGSFDWKSALLTFGKYVWLLGAVALPAYDLICCLSLRRQLRGAELLRDNIYIAKNLRSPFVMGLFRPKIYLPAGLDDTSLEFVIIHEKHHIRRLDQLFKALAFLALSVHWFNPLVWLAFALASADMEMSCDEAVIRALGEDARADYSASLLAMASERRNPFRAPLNFSGGEVGARIRNLRRKKAPLWLTIIAAALCTLLAGCLLTDQSNPADEPSHSLDANRAINADFLSVSCATKDTVYYVVQHKGEQYYYHMLHYMDKATGVTGPLCGKPECKHKDSSCNAYFAMEFTNLSVYDGCIYGLELIFDANAGGYGYAVVSVNLDGTGRRIVRKLDNELTELPYRYSTTYFHRGYVYRVTRPYEIVDGKELVRNNICAFPLDLEEGGTVILDEEPSDSIRVQFYGDSMYIITRDDDDFNDIKIRRWDIKTGAMETIFDGCPPFAWLLCFWVTDNGIFMGGNIPSKTNGDGEQLWDNNVYWYDFASGEFELKYTLMTTTVCNINVSENVFIDSTIEGDGRRFVVKDLEGQTLLDTFISVDMLPFYGVVIQGADETNLYLYTQVDPESFIVIPLDGSDARVLWHDQL